MTVTLIVTVVMMIATVVMMAATVVMIVTDEDDGDGCV